MTTKYTGFKKSVCKKAEYSSFCEYVFYILHWFRKHKNLCCLYALEVMCTPEAGLKAAQLMKTKLAKGLKDRNPVACNAASTLFQSFLTFPHDLTELGNEDGDDKKAGFPLSLGSTGDRSHLLSLVSFFLECVWTRIFSNSRILISACLKLWSSRADHLWKKDIKRRTSNWVE